MNNNSEHYNVQSQYFDKESINSVNHIYDKASRKELKEFLRFLKLNKVEGLKILEVGAGTGRYTVHLLHMGAHVTATEISNESLNVIKMQAKEIEKEQNLITVHDSLESAIFNDEFDLVFCVNLLHHVEDMHNVFKNMYKAAKPNAIVAIIEPNPLNPLFYIDFYRKKNWSIEKGILRCKRWLLKDLFLENNMDQIFTKRYIIIPNFISNKSFLFKYLNNILLSLPIINEFYMFHMMYSRK